MPIAVLGGQTQLLIDPKLDDGNPNLRLRQRRRWVFEMRCKLLIGLLHLLGESETPECRSDTGLGDQRRGVNNQHSPAGLQLLVVLAQAFVALAGEQVGLLELFGNQGQRRPQSLELLTRLQPFATIEQDAGLHQIQQRFVIVRIVVAGHVIGQRL